MNETIKVRRVTEQNRLDFLPRYFTPCWMLRGESLVYAWLRRLSPDYQGGYWEFYELSNGGFYLAPTGQEALRLIVEGNDFDKAVSADAAGIVATLFALNQWRARPAANGLSICTIGCGASRWSIRKGRQSCGLSIEGVET